MNRINKIFRLLAFICLIILAGIGIGMYGGVPLPVSKNRRKSEKENIELIENQDKNSDSQQGEIIG